MNRKSEPQLSPPRAGTYGATVIASERRCEWISTQSFCDVWKMSTEWYHSIGWLGFDSQPALHTRVKRRRPISKTVLFRAYDKTNENRAETGWWCCLVFSSICTLYNIHRTRVIISPPVRGARSAGWRTWCAPRTTSRRRGAPPGGPPEGYRTALGGPPEAKWLGICA